MEDLEADVTFALSWRQQVQKGQSFATSGMGRSDHAHAEATRPIGVDDDADFQAGRDTTHYALPLGSGRYAVEVRLLFQSLSSRYVAELLEHDTPEVKAFAGLYSKADRSPHHHLDSQNANRGPLIDRVESVHFCATNTPTETSGSLLDVQVLSRANPSP